jgi:hypothetical protein
MAGSPIVDLAEEKVNPGLRSSARRSTLVAVCSLLRAVALVLFLTVILPSLAGAPVTLVYRQRTGNRVDRIEITEQVSPEGSVLGVAASSGETYRIESDSSGGVTSCTFTYPPGSTSWTARRDGTSLRLEGTVQGRPVRRTFKIDAHPWYESVERSLQSFAVSGSTEPKEFWMIEPYGGGAYLMAGRIERRGRSEVNGATVDAVQVVVRPAGILSFLWSSTYWYAPADGTFLRSQSIRGLLPVIPPTVIELLEDRR